MIQDTFRENVDGFVKALLTYLQAGLAGILVYGPSAAAVRIQLRMYPAKLNKSCLKLGQEIVGKDFLPKTALTVSVLIIYLYIYLLF